MHGSRNSTLVAAVVAVFGCTLLGCPPPPSNTAPAQAPAAPVTSEAKPAPLVPKHEVADWCQEHGVPESQCTRCNADLIAGFKKKGDWCEKHGLPDSQCVTCHPEVEAKLKAMAPK